MKNRIYHDLESTAKVLPEVKELMEKLMSLHRTLEIIDGIEVDNEDDDVQLEMTETELNIEFHRNMLIYHTLLRKLVALGAYVKDLDMGIVDFYSKHDNRDILLCWMYGEDEIAHYHEVDDEFSLRKPIANLRSESNNVKNES